jgi:hypothetical protein
MESIQKSLERNLLSEFKNWRKNMVSSYGLILHGKSERRKSQNNNRK